MGALSKTSRPRARATVRQEQAIQLRIAGGSYQSIGQQLGISKEAARKLVKRGLSEVEKLCDEKAAELRRIEVARLDRLQASLWKRAVEGDVAAAKQCGVFIQQRCALLGLDKIPPPPEPAEAYVPDTLEDA